MAMSAPPRGWLARRTRGHPMLFAVGVACVAAVLVELALTGGWFRATAPGATIPELNPFHDQIASFTGNVAYDTSRTGGASNYFPALDNQNLCPGVCPVAPRIWSAPNGSGWVVGVRAFVNVTNTATDGYGYYLWNFSLTVGGPSPRLLSFLVATCSASSGCETLESPVYMVPEAVLEIEIVAYSMVALPQSPAGGFTLWFNATSP